MRIYYHLSEYISHRESGLDFIDCLKFLGHQVTTNAAEAFDARVAVIHDDPMTLPGIFSRMPFLRHMRTIAYAVWEGDRLPPVYATLLRMPKEIWTCSRFVKDVLAPHFPGAAAVPHVVRREPFSADDMAFAARATRAEDGSFLFFSVVDSINPRKNIRGLLTAFALARKKLRAPARLVLKQYRAAFDLSHLPGVISIEGELTRGQMAALFAVSHAYVSAHHAEGWGLGISSAMAFGKPAIATAYSGNMEYMNEGNSLPVPYALVPVAEEMCNRLPLFTADMRWAEPDPAALAQAMMRAAEKRYPADLPERAAEVCRRFSVESVSGIMNSLLGEG